jgi:hypothetical protein
LAVAGDLAVLAAVTRDDRGFILAGGSDLLSVASG